jgi:hypothetical protein
VFAWSIYPRRVNDDRAEMTDVALAAQFREIANRTAWNPDDDPGDVLDRLWTFYTEITEVVSSDDILGRVLAAKPLGEIYGYAMGLRKSIDVFSRGRHPEWRAISHADHLDDIRSVMPTLHAQLQDRLAELDRAYPPQ